MLIAACMGEKYLWILKFNLGTPKVKVSRRWSWWLIFFSKTKKWNQKYCVCKLSKIWIFLILLFWNSPTLFNVAAHSPWRVDVRSYSLKSKASFHLTEDWSNPSPHPSPFIPKRHLLAEGELMAQTSSSKVLQITEGEFFFSPFLLMEKLLFHW